MEISQVLLGLMFSISVGVGAALGFVYDVFRFVRVLSGEVTDQKRGRLRGFLSATVVFFEDFVFCIICGVSFLLLIYYTNDGQLRGLALIGTLAGAFLYSNTIGRLTSRLFPWLGIQVRRIAAAIVKILLLPFVLLKAIYLATVGRMLKAAGARIKRIKDEKYTARAIQKYRDLAADGFGLADLYKNADNGEINSEQKF